MGMSHMITADEVQHTRLTTHLRLLGGEAYDADEVDRLLDEYVVPTLRVHERGLRAEIHRFLSRERTGK